MVINSKRKRLNKSPLPRVPETPETLKEALIAALDDPNLSGESIKGKIVGIFERLSHVFQQSSGCGCICNGPSSVQSARSVPPSPAVNNATSAPPQTLDSGLSVDPSGVDSIAHQNAPYNIDFTPWSTVPNKKKKTLIPPRFT